MRCSKKKEMHEENKYRNALMTQVSGIRNINEKTFQDICVSSLVYPNVQKKKKKKAIKSKVKTNGKPKIRCCLQSNALPTRGKKKTLKLSKIMQPKSCFPEW